MSAVYQSMTKSTTDQIAIKSDDGMHIVHRLLTDHLDIWTSAEAEKKSSSGRTAGNGAKVYGIKKLRELILELAVHGKLVPQERYDEPANELLKRIKTEKAKRVVNGKVKVNSFLLKDSQIDNKFELPQGWAFSHLADLVNILNGRAYKKEELLDSGTPVLRVGNLFTSDHWYYSDLVLEEEKYCNPGDLLFAWSASFGPFIWNGNRAIYHYHIWKLDFYSKEDLYKPYLYLLLREQTEKIKSAGHGVSMIHMTKEKMEKLIVPLPPLAEQRRIVAKVDELMALCDQLEARHIDAAEAHEKFVNYLLGTLTESQHAEDFAVRWQRIAVNFDMLFITEASIDALKQTLLQLAVMGKLVPQDSNDVPASEILKKIESVKKALIVEGRTKNPKAKHPLAIDVPFELPPTWEWIKLEDLMPEFQNGASSRGDHNGKPVVVLRLADIKNGKITVDDPRELIISEQTISKYRLAIGDVVIIRVNGSADLVGGFIACEENFEGIYCDHFIRMRISKDFMNPRFAMLLGGSELIRSRIKDLFITTAGQKTVNQTHISSLLIPLLSTAEQARIVAKVDELMSFCDQLKSRIVNINQLQKKLADVIVEQAVA